VLTQYNKQYLYNFCTIGIEGYLRGHISQEIFSFSSPYVNNIIQLISSLEMRS